MGPLQNEKMRMLGCKGVRLGNGQMAVNDDAMICLVEVMSIM